MILARSRGYSSSWANLKGVLALCECAYVVIDAVDESRESRPETLIVLKILATDLCFKEYSS